MAVYAKLFRALRAFSISFWVELTLSYLPCISDLDLLVLHIPTLYHLVRLPRTCSSDNTSTDWTKLAVGRVERLNTWFLSYVQRTAVPRFLNADWLSKLSLVYCGYSHPSHIHLSDCARRRSIRIRIASPHAYPSLPFLACYAVWLLALVQNTFSSRPSCISVGRSNLPA